MEVYQIITQASNINNSDIVLVMNGVLANTGFSLS